MMMDGDEVNGTNVASEDLQCKVLECLLSLSPITITSQDEESLFGAFPTVTSQDTELESLEKGAS